MGAGKTSVGKRLASRMKLPFYDLDHELENQEKLSVQEIFDKNGEKYFREIERQWIEQMKVEKGVISLGGGTPCEVGMMDLINSKGTTVYIKPSLGIIVSRLIQSKTKRPLIEAFKSDKVALSDFVAKKLEEREVHYLKADIVFESSDVKADKLDELVDLLTSA